MRSCFAWMGCPEVMEIFGGNLGAIAMAKCRRLRRKVARKLDVTCPQLGLERGTGPSRWKLGTRIWVTYIEDDWSCCKSVSLRKNTASSQLFFKLSEKWYWQYIDGRTSLVICHHARSSTRPMSDRHSCKPFDSIHFCQADFFPSPAPPKEWSETTGQYWRPQLHPDICFRILVALSKHLWQCGDPWFGLAMIPMI